MYEVLSFLSNHMSVVTGIVANHWKYLIGIVTIWGVALQFFKYQYGDKKTRIFIQREMHVFEIELYEFLKEILFHTCGPDSKIEIASKEEDSFDLSAEGYIQRFEKRILEKKIIMRIRERYKMRRIIRLARKYVGCFSTRNEIKKNRKKIDKLREEILKKEMRNIAPRIGKVKQVDGLIKMFEDGKKGKCDVDLDIFR